MARRWTRAVVAVGLGLVCAMVPASVRAESFPRPAGRLHLEMLQHSLDALASTTHRARSTFYEGYLIADLDPKAGVAREVYATPMNRVANDLRVIGQDAYVRMDNGGWVHLGGAKLRPDGHVALLMRRLEAEMILAGITTSTRIGPRSYVGVSDLERARDTVPTPVIVRYLEERFPREGASRYASPFAEFRITVDELGRLATLAYRLPPPRDYPDPVRAWESIVITQYGVPVHVERPAENLVVEGTDDWYAGY